MIDSRSQEKRTFSRKHKTILHKSQNKIKSFSEKVRPDFEEKILEGDAYIKGTVRGLRLFVLICNLIFDKNIKTTYKAIKNWKR